MKVLHTVLLFIIHFVQGCFWLIWTLWKDDLSLGVAPLFINGCDTICYLTKRAGNYCVTRSNFLTNEEVYLFETYLPIQQLVYNGKCLYFSTYSRKGNLLVQITLNGNPTIDKTDIVAGSRDYILSTNPLSLVEVTSMCSETGCTFIVSRTDEIGRNEYDLCYNKVLSVAVSESGKYVGYSTEGTVSVLSDNLKSHFDISKVYFMRGSNNKLLAYCRHTDEFVKINCEDMNYITISLPREFLGKFVLSAALSPEGKHIAFFVYDPKSIGELVILSFADNSYRILAKKARVYDIRWSPSAEYISISGVFERDFFEIAYTYKMRNGAVNDKEVLDMNGMVIWQSN